MSAGNQRFSIILPRGRQPALVGDDTGCVTASSPTLNLGAGRGPRAGVPRPGSSIRLTPNLHPARKRERPGEADQHNE